MMRQPHTQAPRARPAGWPDRHLPSRLGHAPLWAKAPGTPAPAAAARRGAGPRCAGRGPDAGGLRPAVGRQFHLPGFPARTNSNPGFGRQGRGARLAPPGCGKSFGTAECRVSVRQLSGSHARKRSTTQRELTLGSNPPPTRRWRSQRPRRPTVGGEWLGTAATPGMTETERHSGVLPTRHTRPLGGSLRTRGMNLGTRPLE